MKIKFLVGTKVDVKDEELFFSRVYAVRHRGKRLPAFRKIFFFSSSTVSIRPLKNTVRRLQDVAHPSSDI